jgi:hypothetical protein
MVALLGSLFLAACSSGELVGIHISLNKDGSGVVTTRSLAEPTAPGPAESRTQGVTWQSRASLIAVQGKFDKLNDLKFGGEGLRFSAQLGDEQPHLRVYLQRGAGAEWCKGLVPDAAVRRAMARVYDPTGRTQEIGDTLRIEFAVPGEVVTSDVNPGGRGVEPAHERKRAYLLIPVKTLLEAADEMVWDISWR